MSSGTRLLVKILVAVVSYGVTFALAIYAVSNFNFDGGNTAVVWIIIVILAICGFKALSFIPFLSFSGGGGAGIAITLMLLLFRVFFSVIAGIFIAPWMIAKKLVLLIPGGEAEDAEE